MAAASDLSLSSAVPTVAVANGKARSRRKDGVGSVGIVDSSDADVEEEGDGEEDRWGTGIGWRTSSKGWVGFKLGMG